jgi:hypothetical protein
MSAEEAKAYGLIDEIIQGKPKGDGPVPRLESNGGGPRGGDDGAPEAGGGAATR